MGDGVRGFALKLAIGLGVVVVLTAGIVVIVVFNRAKLPSPGCTFSQPQGSSYTFSLEQSANAATISAVGTKLGLPPHAATIALATALQESKLRNIEGGDRDSEGLFQQRPSQGWGTIAQLRDPVYASTAFYEKLEKLPGWETMPITEAAQAIQRSGAPDAYAQWEPQSRVMAAALNGQVPASVTCRDLTPANPADIAAVATKELGTAKLSGPHPADEGWTIASWLVARASDLGVDRVSFAGQVWTSSAGAWSADSSAGEDLKLHQEPAPAT